MRANWVHPSIRDLVIDHVAGSPALRATFLENASINGIKLALSRAGGTSGERELPFLQADEDWSALADRVASLLRDGDDNMASALLAELVGLSELAVENPSGGSTPQIRALITNSLGALVVRWNEAGDPILIPWLETYCEVSKATEPLAPIPALDASWAKVLDDLASGDDLSDSIEAFGRLVVIAEKNEPRFLVRVGWPDAHRGVLGDMIENARTEIEQENHFEPPDDPEDWPGENPVSGWLPSLNSALMGLKGVVPSDVWAEIDALSDEGFALESSWDDYDATHEGNSEDWERYIDSEPSEVFDIHAFFADL